MRISPPTTLVQLLERLRLASAEQLAAAAPLARRLAGDLPDFESVWVDALAQRQILTRWQAAEINAGRAEQLMLGPYLLKAPANSPHYAQCFCARHADTGREVHLYRIQRTTARIESTVSELQSLTTRGASLEGVVAIDDFGISGPSIWAACAPAVGTPVAAWMVEHGRLSPLAVLEIARQMTAQLAQLEAHQIVHGDVCAAGLLLDESGRVVLPAPGLRGAVRPQEGFSFADLCPEAYDYLAPERIAQGSPPDGLTDIYACGALWWHLLAGRAPFAGGNSLSKLKMVHAARSVEIRRLAPTAPELLCRAIDSCLMVDRNARPATFAELASQLGPPTLAGQALLTGMLRASAGAWHDLRPRRRSTSRATGRRKILAGCGVTAMLVCTALMPALLRESPQATDTTASAQVRERASIAGIPASASSVQAIAKHVDPLVKPAAHSIPNAEPLVEDLVLPAGEALRIEQLDLKPNVRVRGRAGSRPLLLVPARGLEIATSGVRFEGIDFVWRAEPSASATQPPAMLALHCQTAFFDGCSFSTLEELPPAAIQFAGTAETLPGLGGELTFTNCVFDGVTSVVNYSARGGLAARFENCLCVAAGPLVCLPRVNSTDEPVSIALDGVTLRGDSAVLECRHGSREAQPGNIAITAQRSALAGKARGGLIAFVGSGEPKLLTRSLSWSGQGSIVVQQVPVLTWISEPNRIRPIPEDELEIAGLVRGELEFAGRPDAPPAASRVLHWQAPLRSDEPPGADPARLNSLRSRSDH